MKIAIISTFRTHCGIAFNTEYVANELTKLVDLKIFAEKIFPPFTEIPPKDDTIKLNYERCWKRGENFKELEKKISEFSPDVVHFNFTGGIYNEFYEPFGPFQNFVSELRNKKIKIVLTLQDVLDYFPQNFQRLSLWYKKLQAKFIVMNQDMVNALQQWYPEGKENVILIPHGCPKFPLISTSDARKSLEISSQDFLLSSFGFYGPYKGMDKIINAIPKIDIPNFKVIFVGGFHELSEYIHRKHINDCIKLAIKLNVSNKVIFLNKLILADEFGLWCSASDFIISLQEMVYVRVASSSVHIGLSFGKPHIMGNNPRYSVFVDGTHCIKTDENKIAETIMSLYNNKDLQNKISRGAFEYAQENSFEMVAKKYLEVYESCLKN